MLGFIFPLPVLFDEGVSTDTLLTLCLLTQAGSAPACGNIIYLLFRTNLILSLDDVVVLHQESYQAESQWVTRTISHHLNWSLRIQESGLNFQDIRAESGHLSNEFWGLRSEDWRLWTEHMPFCFVKINRRKVDWEDWEDWGLVRALPGRANEGVWPAGPPANNKAVTLCGPTRLLQARRQNEVTAQGKYQQLTDT